MAIITDLSPAHHVSPSFVSRGKGKALSHLLSLPNGLHFRGRELVFLLALEKDLRLIKELVFKCSDTVECLDVRYECSGTFLVSVSGGVVNHPHRRPGSHRRLKSDKTENVSFGCSVPEMLETITPEHRDLRQVSIYLPFIPRDDAAGFMFNFGVDLYEKWLRLPQAPPTLGVAFDSPQGGGNGVSMDGHTGNERSDWVLFPK